MEGPYRKVFCFLLLMGAVIVNGGCPVSEDSQGRMMSYRWEFRMG